jgi:hypothetical protein
MWTKIFILVKSGCYMRFARKSPPLMVILIAGHICFVLISPLGELRGMVCFMIVMVR